MLLQNGVFHELLDMFVIAYKYSINIVVCQWLQLYIFMIYCKYTDTTEPLKRLDFVEVFYPVK